jgi:hypothetical protein
MLQKTLNNPPVKIESVKQLVLKLEPVWAKVEGQLNNRHGKNYPGGEYFYEHELFSLDL